MKFLIVNYFALCVLISLAESKDNNDQIEKFVNNFSEYFAGYKKKEQEKVKKNNAEF